jgi:SAP domain
MPIPNILILDDASLKISTDATTVNLKELACSANHVELAPDTAVTTVDTMCGSVDYPGTTKWSLVATLYQSFDVDAAESVLSAAVTFKNPVAFEVVPRKTPVISATNPAWSGLVRPAPYSPINGDAGDASTIELEWAITSGPTKRTTPTILVFEDMTLDELREAAATAGLSTSGNKADLIERLQGGAAPESEAA